MKRLSILIFFIAVLTDWYDGWHARKFKSITRLGIFIDPLADKILTSFSFILFASLNIVPLWIVLIIIIRDIIITLLRSIREFEGKYFKTSYIAKVKTFVQMSYIFLILLILLLLTFDIDLEYKNMLQKFILINNPVNYSVILLVTVITIYTGISYFFERNPKVEIN